MHNCFLWNQRNCIENIFLPNSIFVPFTQKIWNLNYSSKDEDFYFNNPPLWKEQTDELTFVFYSYNMQRSSVSPIIGVLLFVYLLSSDFYFITINRE